MASGDELDGLDDGALTQGEANDMVRRPWTKQVLRLCCSCPRLLCDCEPANWATRQLGNRTQPRYPGNISTTGPPMDSFRVCSPPAFASSILPISVAYAQEDQLIMKLVDKYGTRKWSLIANHLNGRSGKQCRERSPRTSCIILRRRAP